MLKHFSRMPYMALCLFLVLIFSSCEKILPEKLDFDLKEITFSFTLPAADTTGEFVLETNRLSVDLDSALKAQNIDNYTVSGVKAVRASLETSTPDANFNNFQSFAIFIRSVTLPEIKLADQTAIPQNVQTVKLTTSVKNIVEYLNDKPTTFIVKANIKDALDKPISITMKVTLNMEVSKN